MNLRRFRKTACVRRKRDRIEIGITSSDIDLIAEDVLDMFRSGEWECEGVRSISDARVFTKAALARMIRDIHRYPLARLNGAYREPGAFEAGAEAVWNRRS